MTDVDDALSRDAYWRARAWKKVAVILAGPATNLAFALAALAVVFAVGVPVAETIEEVDPQWPAAEAGLRAGDEILAIDGERVSAVLTERVPIRIAEADGRPVTVTVERDGETVTVGPVRPRLQDGAYRLGVLLRPEERRFAPLAAAGMAAREAWAITAATGSALGRIVTGSGSARKEVTSPVGIVQGSSQALEVGFEVYLRILALISLSLALLNMLPLLPLDGGHITFSLIEATRGRAIPRIAYERVSMVGIFLVLMLFALGLSNDLGGRDFG